MELPTARSTIRGAEVVIPCPDLAPTLAYFIDTLGFRLDAISPRAGVLRRCAPDTGHQPWCHDGDIWSLVVLNGSAELQRSGSNEPLEAGDCAVIPPGEPFTLARNSTDFEFLEVAMPAGGLRTVGSS